ncbi:hypothetical protein KJ840_01485 [Patescibacteria group bacterium]|nr:hypothetical protein [Patescibacteria group bacterium]
MEDKKIVDKLVEKVPEFKIFVDESVKDNSGEVLSYLVFNDLANFFILKFKKGEKDTIKAIQNYLEELLGQNDKEVTELVLFGFLENLKPENVSYEDIKNILTPKLLEYLKEIDKWSQGKD